MKDTINKIKRQPQSGRNIHSAYTWQRIGDALTNLWGQPHKEEGKRCEQKLLQKKI